MPLKKRAPGLKILTEDASKIVTALVRPFLDYTQSPGDYLPHSQRFTRDLS